MIFLNDNTTNYVVLTLLENSLLYQNSGVTPYYLFEFISPASNENIFFTANNLSTSQQQLRFDSFNITLTGSNYVNLTASTIYMRPGMWWDYNIYEQTQQYNLNPANTVSIVETGKVMFSSSTLSQQTLYTFYSTSGSTARTFYTNYN